MIRKTLAFLAATTAVLAAHASDAQARIQCRDGYQLVQGSYIATPYCKDEELARVAREYGMKTSAAEIRNNPNHKRYVCQLLGPDIRIKETCMEAGVTGRRGH